MKKLLMSFVHEKLVDKMEVGKDGLLFFGLVGIDHRYTLELLKGGNDFLIDTVTPLLKCYDYERWNDEVTESRIACYNFRRTMIVPVNVDRGQTNGWGNILQFDLVIAKDDNGEWVAIKNRYGGGWVTNWFRK